MACPGAPAGRGSRPGKAGRESKMCSVPFYGLFCLELKDFLAVLAGVEKRTVGLYNQCSKS